MDNEISKGVRAGIVRLIQGIARDDGIPHQHGSINRPESAESEYCSDSA